jgi:hypothetical protein
VYYGRIPVCVYVHLLVYISKSITNDILTEPTARDSSVMHFNSTTKWGKIKVGYESHRIKNKKAKNIEEKSDGAGGIAATNNRARYVCV